MQYSIQKIAEIVGGEFVQSPSADSIVEHILLDSRQVAFPSSSLFIAMPGQQRDGHDFLEKLESAGVRNFLISKWPVQFSQSSSSNYILVKDTLVAFQMLAAHHRRQFEIPVIGVTGSNGKTIVKEWLFQLLREDYHIVRSPKSYNSQIGVPLSVLQMKSEHELAIFEAGISQPGEMEKLAKIIRPTIGVFTNLGEAHSEGFENMEQKRKEKWKLFKEVEAIIDGQKIKKGKREVPFTDAASIENALTCWGVMLHLGYTDRGIAERMRRLEPVAMRLELKEAVNGCTIVNDSYNSDLTSFQIALDFLRQQAPSSKRTVILSDILQSGKSPRELYARIAELLVEKGVERLIGIGEKVAELDNLLPQNFDKLFFKNTLSFLSSYPELNFHNETILIKGARSFGFEKIAERLAAKVHQTVLEVNLTALLNNLRVYQNFLQSGTKLMVMVKASAYGSGSVQVTKLLEFQQIDYLAVAYADEGVELRQAGIQLPVLVLNPEEATFDSLIEYRLEPEIYSLDLLRKFIDYVEEYGEGKTVKVHLKIDTGMRRLGFEEKDLEALLKFSIFKPQSSIVIQSIFSHLVASESPAHDEYSRLQIERFENIYQRIVSVLNYRPMRHILNTGGIIRFPECQMEMVRLGIGLYGVDESGIVRKKLQTVNTLRATVSQVKKITAGETVGYGRMGKAEVEMSIATISIGYADGLPRRAGNGRFSVLIRGQRAPLFGNICMDMSMVDVSHIPDVKPGDEVIVFGVSQSGESLPVEELAECLDTIPYEVFTSISERVKRVYVQE